MVRADFLAFNYKLAYNNQTNQVGESLLGLQYMPARTLNDFFAVFFCTGIRADTRVNIVISLDKDQGRSGAKEIKVEDVILFPSSSSIKWQKKG